MTTSIAELAGRLKSHVCCEADNQANWRILRNILSMLDPVRGVTDLSNVRWGKCKSNWVNAGGTGPDYVPVYPCDDRLGNDTDTDTEHTVYLPLCGDAAGGKAGDPILIGNDIIAYAATRDRDGRLIDPLEFVCVSSYLGAKIFSVMLWTGDLDSIPAGWAYMNGTANTAPYGSGIDMRGMFVQEGTPSNVLSGSNSHTHDGEAESHTTGISVDAHADHTHPIPLSTPAYGRYADPPNEWALCDEACTDGSKEGDCGDAADWTHSVVDPGHVHTLDIDSGPNIPEHKHMYFIERIDNSTPV